MAILLLFYKLILERESMHTFKRIFLLSALVVSFIIPTIVFVEYVEPTILSNPQISTTSELSELPTETAPITKPTDMDVVNWSMLFWTIYCLGLIGFGFRFFRNLFQILNRIKNNPKLRENFNIKVLLREKLPPHTFFSYIFLNKNKFETKAIPQAVLTHEETHAKEYHSLDVLFIELLQVLFWFNPLVYLYKRSIKLNHEFLADSAVLKKENSTSNYQNTLLSYLSKESLEKYQSTGIANAINYSSIKKRFTVMKKRTSKKSFVLRSFLLLPLIALLLFGFSTSRKIEKTTDNFEITDYTARSLSIDFQAKGNYLIEGKKANKDSFVKVISEFNTDVEPETRNKILNIHLTSSREIPNSEVWFVYNSVLEYGFYRIITPNQEIIREKGNTPFSIEKKAVHEDIELYNELAEKYNIVPIEKRIIPLEDLKLLETIYRDMTDEQKQNAQPFPECLPKNKQDGATREEMKEYNSLAKKYNEMDRNQMWIKNSEVKRLKALYSKMSDKQKADAEPFPDFPKPPPVPDAPEIDEIKEVPSPKPPKNVSDVDYASNQIENIIDKQDPYDVVGGGIKTGKTTFPEPPIAPTYVKEIQPIGAAIPQAPPEPESPMDHIISMAKKGATFMYEGKEISSDKAIEILKNNNKINIESKSDNGKPTVRLSTKPITIK